MDIIGGRTLVLGLALGLAQCFGMTEAGLPWKASHIQRVIICGKSPELPKILPERMPITSMVRVFKAKASFRSSSKEA